MTDPTTTLDAVARMGAETLITTRETAEALRITERTLERWRMVGLGPAVTRIGPRRTLYRVKDVLAFAGAEAAG
jgi:hypothetical protein